MDKGYVFVFITDNDLVVFTPLMAKYNVQFISEVKDWTCYVCP